MLNKIKTIKTITIVRMVYLLLCLCLATGVTYSRYMASISGADSAALAAFTITSDITETASVTVPYNIKTDGTVYTYELTIENYDGSTTNNVTLDYTATLETTGNLPLIVTLREADTGVDSTDSYTALEDGYGEVIATATSVQTDSTDPQDAAADTYTYTIIDGILPHTEQVTHVYYIEVAWDTKADDYKAYEYAYEIDLITITINAEQSLDDITTIIPSNGITTSH